MRGKGNKRFLLPGVNKFNPRKREVKAKANSRMWGKNSNLRKLFFLTFFFW